MPDGDPCVSPTRLRNRWDWDQPLCSMHNGKHPWCMCRELRAEGEPHVEGCPLANPINRDA